MKIAITGSTAGIGLALSNILRKHGHEIVELSRRLGYNIKSVPKVVNIIEDCDLFINNAQDGYSQTELLFEVFNRWQDKSNKKIWVISTDLTRMPSAIDIPGHTKLEVIKYRNQKLALEDACRQLQMLHLVDILIIKPGAVATQEGQSADEFPYCNVDDWATTLVNLLKDLDNKHLSLKEFSLVRIKSQLGL